MECHILVFLRKQRGVEMRPSVFVGSSSEGSNIAGAIQVLLDEKCEVELWSQGVFGLSEGTLESLLKASMRFDYAVLVLTADDLLIMRDTEINVARDNVIFELGLFMGSIGRDRTFTVYDRTKKIKLPSDLIGITACTFEPHTTGNLEASLGAPCRKILNTIERAGVRTSNQMKEFGTVTEDFVGLNENISNLIGLIARSRKLELDIISTQFGPLINSKKLEQMKQDIDELNKTLLERAIRNDPEIKNILNNHEKKSIVDDAILCFCYNIEPKIPEYKKSEIWQITEAVYNKNVTDSI